LTHALNTFVTQLFKSKHLETFKTSDQWNTGKESIGITIIINTTGLKCPYSGRMMIEKIILVFSYYVGKFKKIIY